MPDGEPAVKPTMAEWWKETEELQRSRGKGMLFVPLIKRGDLVFDIGANRGLLTMLFRDLGARVVAVEPLFAIGKRFVREFDWKFGDDEMVTTIPLAISTRPRIVMWVHQNQPVLSSVSSAWMRKSAHKGYYHKKNTRPKWVRTTTINALIAEYGMPSFIKVDVEGSENNVIRTLSKPVAAMSMEFHEDWVPKPSMKHMMKLADYEWNYALNETGKYALGVWTTIKRLLSHMRNHLTKGGPESWGDIYCRIRV